MTKNTKNIMKKNTKNNNQLQNNSPEYIERGVRKEVLKSNYDFVDLIRALGCWQKGGGKWVYFGDPGTPVNKHRAYSRTNPWYYKNFNTDKGGDIIQYIKDTRNMSFEDAVDYLYDLLVGGGVVGTAPTSPITKNRRKTQYTNNGYKFTDEQKEKVELLKGQFQDEHNKEYIKNRNEVILSFIDKKPFMDQVEAGVFGKDIIESMENIYSNFIVLPWYGIDKELKGLQLRTTEEAEMKYGWARYTDVSLTEPLVDREKGTLFITEGLFKARALAKIGFRTIALASITTRKGITELLDQIEDKKKIILALDNDIFELGEENGKKDYYKMTNFFDIVGLLHQYKDENKLDMEIKTALFPLEYKGIDDFIYACKKTTKKDISLQYPVIGTMDAIKAIDNFKKNGTFLDFDANRDKSNKYTFSNIANVMTDKEIWDRSNKLGLYDRLIFVIADEFYKVVEEYNYTPRKELRTYAQNYRNTNVYLLNIVLSWLVERGVQEFLMKNLKIPVFKKGADKNFIFANPGSLSSNRDKADLEVKDKNYYIEVLTKCSNYEMIKAIKQGRGSKYKNLLELAKSGSRVEIAYVDFIDKKVVFWRVREDMELGEVTTPQAPGQKGTSLNFTEEDIIREIPLSMVF